MSHFCMWAVTKTDNEEALEKVMQPYHEYECTGIEDEYVVQVDRTEDAIECYERLKDEYANAREFLEEWYGVEYIDHESEQAYKSSQYAIISDDETKIIKYYEYTNPNAKWDWWVIGGRWSSNNQDMIKKSDFDYDAWFEKEKKYYTDLWNLYHPLFEKHKDTLVEWDSNAENHVKMLEVYQNQPLMKELNDESNTYNRWDFNWQMIKPLDEYLDFMLKTASPCFGIVTEDGWFEKGNMGWWACVSDENPDWNSDFKKLWDSIPDNCYIWNVDCHI